MSTIKKYEKYTSKDIFKYWGEEYKAKHNVAYTYREFGGRELSRFKEALETHGVYTILLAIKQGIADGQRSVRFFCENIESYILDTAYAKYIFLIKSFGPPELKVLLVELGVLETKWTQNSRTMKRLKEIVQQFEDWCEIKGY